MNKSQYLADKNVKEFVNWLSLELKNKSLLHHYVMPGERRVTFTGLEDALEQYDWPFNFQEPGTNVIRNGNSFTQNDAALTDLKAGLDASLALAPVSGRDAQTRDWAISVMGWGGVRNGNVSWLDANVNGLANEIDAACTLLESGNDDKSILRGTIRRFNAGMTKVYSLLVDDFIIYDSRVAAALTWLVVRWCLDQKTKQTSVPDMLCFPCMRPKEGDNPAIRKVRNPNCAGFLFPCECGHLI